MSLNNKSIYINITIVTVIKILLIFVLFYFLFLVREILVIFFVSLILASAIGPWVDWMQDKKVPRGLGIMLIYLVLSALVFGSIFLIIPPIMDQINELNNNFPQIAEKVISEFSVLKEYSEKSGLLNNIKTAVESFSMNMSDKFFSTVSGFLGGIVSFFMTLVITFYMVAEENAMKKIIWSLAPEKYQIYIVKLVNRMQQKIGLWLRGQLILSLIIFALTYIALSILKIKYALILALIAGLTEFIPYFGPSIAAVPAVFLSLNKSLFFAFIVAILYFIIQWVENNIIVPKLMQKVIGLNPVVSIAVLLIGFKLTGVIGAILALPVATAASVFLKDVFENKIPGSE